MNQYLQELSRVPYYRRQNIALPTDLQKKLMFDATASFEAEQRRLMEERRRLENEMLEQHAGDYDSGDTPTNNTEPLYENIYLQPDMASLYYQPDEVSLYLQP